LTDLSESLLRLAAAERGPLPRIYLPTFNRWKGVTPLDLCPSLEPYAVLVHEAVETGYYDLNYPEVEKVVIPHDYAGTTRRSVGRARRFILEHAKDERYIMLDDDLLDAQLITMVGEDRVTRTGLNDMPVADRIYGALALFWDVMLEAWGAVPSAVLGAPQATVAFPKTFPGEAKTKWRLNYQDAFFCIAVDGLRYWSIVDYHLDVEKWYGVGEDKAINIETLLAGGDIVDVPSLLLKSPYCGGVQSNIPREVEMLKVVAGNYREYGEDFFTKPRWNEALGVHDSWNISFGKFRKKHPDRVKEVLWTA
jgi:hypothetical protein